MYHQLIKNKKWSEEKMIIVKLGKEIHTDVHEWTNEHGQGEYVKGDSIPTKNLVQQMFTCDSLEEAKEKLFNMFRNVFPLALGRETTETFFEYCVSDGVVKFATKEDEWANEDENGGFIVDYFTSVEFYKAELLDI